MMELHLDLDCPSSHDAGKARKALARKQRKAARHGASGYSGGSLGGSPLVARNDNQAALIGYAQETPVVFSVGPEGTGKTYLPARVAIKKLIQAGNGIDKIYLTRPTAAPDRHRLGFLPGNARAKMGPWLTPIFDAFKDETSAANIDKWEKEGKIEVVPFEHLRGRSLHGAVILLTEAQNCTFGDLRLVVTRIGENSQMFIDGDENQTDIGRETALETFIEIAQRYGVDCGVVRFTENDVTRSEVAQQWVRALAAYNRRTIH